MDTLISTSKEPVSWECIALSEAGPRAENQDNYLLVKGDGQAEYLMDEKKQTAIIPHWQENHIRLAVADGMGGHNNGRQASEAVINELMKLEFQTDSKSLRTELIGIHNKLFKQFHQGARTPGSTLVMADITPDGRALIANIGDSRAYIFIFHENRWKKVTRDHTALEFAWRDSEISDKEYAQGVVKNTNQIVQAMGFGSSGIIANEAGIKTKQHLQELRIEIDKGEDKDKNINLNKGDVMTQALKANDVLMLASDGIWSNQKNYLPANLGKQNLTDYTKTQFKSASGKTCDNLTLVLCSMNTTNSTKHNRG